MEFATVGTVVPLIQQETVRHCPFQSPGINPGTSFIFFGQWVSLRESPRLPIILSQGGRALQEVPEGCAGIGTCTDEF